MPIILREQSLRKRIESKAEIYASMRVLRGVHPSEWQCAKQNYQEIAISLAPLLLELAEALESIIKTEPIEGDVGGHYEDCEVADGYDCDCGILEKYNTAHKALSSLDRFLSGGEGKDG